MGPNLFSLPLAVQLSSYAPFHSSCQWIADIVFHSSDGVDEELPTAFENKSLLSLTSQLTHGESLSDSPKQL